MVYYQISRVSQVEQELATLPEHLSSRRFFSGVRFVRSLIFCAILCRSLNVVLFVYFWPLYCLSFFDLRLLISLSYLQTFLITGYSTLYYNISDRGWLYLLASIPAFYIYIDCLAYYFHRMTHTKWLYIHIHKVSI